MENLVDEVSNFWNRRRVLITGHTGFKGAWLTKWLLSKGAVITGLALPPENGGLFEALSLRHEVQNFFDDINTADLDEIFETSKPEIIFHLAAQAIVNVSITNPIQTWLTNVIGSARLYEACFQLKTKSVLISITSDKVYDDNPAITPYRENNPLSGSDPYSASKAANEILLKSWRDTYLTGSCCHAASVRAGNVIGGGDWAKDRIFPDMYRAHQSKTPLKIRNPLHARPWQHVLDPLNGYMVLAEKMYREEDEKLCSPFNFGPIESEPKSVQELVNFTAKRWNLNQVENSSENLTKETSYLALNIEKANKLLGWFPRWNFERSVEETIKWYDQFIIGRAVSDITLEQIKDFETS